LCAIKHKDHSKSESSIQHNGYHVCYAGVNGELYLGVILIVKNSLQPVVVQSDIYGRYIVVEVNFEGQRIWIVGIYAPNEVSQRIEL
jgi:exonuclease III